MILYEECHDLSRPPAWVARSVGEWFPGPAEGEAGGRAQGDHTDGVRRWSSKGRLLTRRATLDPAAGELRVAVVCPDAYRYLALTGLVVAPSVAVLAPRGGVLAVLATVYAVLAVLPGVHHLPGVASLPNVAGTEIIRRRHTPAAAATYLVVGAALFVALGGAERTPGAVTAGVVLAGVAVAHLATASGDTGVPALGIAVVGLVPAVLSGANVLFATAVLDGGGTLGADAAGLAVVCAGALALDALFFLSCARVAGEVAGSRPSSAGSWRRLAGLAAVVLANVALLGATVLGARALTADGGGLSRALSPLGPVTPVATGVVACVLLLPAVVTAAGWAHHLLTGVAAAIWALVRSEPVHLPGVPDGVTVRVIDSRAPVARPLGVPGRPTVVVGRPLVEELDREALAAVACHEAYHLVGRDPATGPLPWVVGALVGGPNAVRALYDRGAVERAADEFAADRVGSDALVRAVRTVGRLQVAADGAFDTAGSPASPAGDDAALRGRLARGAMAPYRLFFGSVVPPAHDDLTRRVARIRGLDRG